MMRSHRKRTEGNDVHSTTRPIPHTIDHAPAPSTGRRRQGPRRRRRTRGLREQLDTALETAPMRMSPRPRWSGSNPFWLRPALRPAAEIVAAVTPGLANGRHEGLNSKVRLVVRRAYGFHTAENALGDAHVRSRSPAGIRTAAHTVDLPGQHASPVDTGAGAVVRLVIDRGKGRPNEHSRGAIGGPARASVASRIRVGGRKSTWCLSRDMRASLDRCKRCRTRQ